jgi:hypothetical protein
MRSSLRLAAYFRLREFPKFSVFEVASKRVLAGPPKINEYMVIFNETRTGVNRIPMWTWQLGATKSSLYIP